MPTETPAVKPRHSEEGEKAVIGMCLAYPRLVGDVIGSGLEPQDFLTGAGRAIYGEIVARYYADEAIEPIPVAEKLAATLGRTWSVQEGEAVKRIMHLAAIYKADRVQVREHAAVVKRYADLRRLLELAAEIETSVDRELESPEEIAGLTSQKAMQIATASLLTQEIISYEDLGRNFIRSQRELMAARSAGIELGVYTGLSFIDSYTRGLRPTELWFLAGEPGAGKSAVAWTAAQKFAERQMRKPSDKQIGTLVASLEMGEEPSSTRLAQSITALDGGMLREGRTEEADLHRVAEEWRKRRQLPMHFNFSSVMRASQLKALVVEAIRRHNVGLVVIDHFKYLDMDGRWRSDLEQEEAKARFLKQDIATQLNVAVVCLAHTTKAIDNTDDKRPTLSHLRGSGQVAAHADFVSFVYRPYNHAKADAIDSGSVKRTDAEMIWRKNRHGLEGTGRFHFDASTMNVH